MQDLESEDKPRTSHLGDVLAIEEHKGQDAKRSKQYKEATARIVLGLQSQTKGATYAPMPCLKSTNLKEMAQMVLGFLIIVGFLASSMYIAPK